MSFFFWGGEGGCDCLTFLSKEQENGFSAPKLLLVSVVNYNLIEQNVQEQEY